jgi:hypothetical protein
MRDLSQVRELMRDVAANGWSSPINVSRYRHIILAFSTSNNANGTLKVAGSVLSGSEVDFTSAAAVDNEWDYVYSFNSQSLTGVAGDTGYAWAGTDAVEHVVLNTDHINTIAVQLSGYAAGNFTVKCIAANDNK